MSSTTPSLAQESKAQPQTAQAPLPLGWREVVPIHRLPVITKTPVMIIAGAYLSHAEFHVNTVIATMVLASALWTVLYYYNELADIKLEKQAEVQSGLDTLCLTLMALLVAMVAIASAAPRYFILDDGEVEEPQHLRIRRDDKYVAAASGGYGGGYAKGHVGPVYTFVKTDPKANFKWGVRHRVGSQYGRR